MRKELKSQTHTLCTHSVCFSVCAHFSSEIIFALEFLTIWKNADNKWSFVGALRDSGGNFLDSNLSLTSLVFRDNRKHKKSLGLTAEGQIMMRKENNGLRLRALSKYRHLPTKSLGVINLNYVSFVALLILCLLTQSSPACAHFIALLWRGVSMWTGRRAPSIIRRKVLPSDFSVSSALLVGRDLVCISDEKD